LAPANLSARLTGCHLTDLAARGPSGFLRGVNPLPTGLLPSDLVDLPVKPGEYRLDKSILDQL